jgi:DNA-binding response OmpR family regulator
MKMLLVAAGDEHANVLAYHLKPLGFELERFEDPVRALSELDETDPQAILFDAGDFPRHWKALLKLAREKKSKEELIFILISPRGGFDLEEAAKAVHLGVNGIIGGKLTDKSELYRLEELVRRYRSVRDKRNFTRLVPTEEDSLGFAFTHPLRMTLVLGRIREISIQGASFYPSRASVVSDLPVGREIPYCSLKVGEHIISVNCRLTRNREELGFQFLSFEEGGHNKLLKYIQTRPERALRDALSRGT